MAVRVTPSAMVKSSASALSSSFAVTIISAASIDSVSVTGLLVSSVTIPPAFIPGSEPLTTPPTVSAPLFIIQVLPVVDVLSILPTSVVTGVPSSPISSDAKR